MFVVLAIVVVILYGSLYPFAFQPGPANGVGPLATLLHGWDKRPGRGDFVSNILLYMPLGFFSAMLAFAGRGTARGTMRRYALIVLLGAGLSFAVEYVQYYDAGRDTEAMDFYANVLGTILGAAAGRILGRGLSWSFLSRIPSRPVPTMLLAAWLGYRLFPYVPTIDLHKYWTALKPVLLYPSATPYAIFRQTAIWVAICLLVEKIAQPKQATLLFGAVAGLVLAGSILIVSTQLTVSQLAGMALAFCVWRLSPRRWRVTIAVLLLGVYVVALRLEPFRFAAAAGHFTWIPFLSFMRGSIDVDVQSFFEKFFLYGALIWLLTETGLRIALASGLVAAMLFVTSCMEVFLPGRSAEITDALIALGVGILIGVVDGAAPAERDLSFRRIGPLVARPRRAR